MASTIRTLMALSAAAATASAYCIIRQEPTPAIPLNQVNNSLVTPPSKPAHIALGLGYQNYTCSATASSPTGTYIQTQTEDGAIANLYDIQNILDDQNIHSLTTNALERFESCLAATKCNAADPSHASNSLLGDCEVCHDAAVSLLGFGLQKIGLHFFDRTPVNNAQAPHFALNRFGAFLAAKKSGDVKAPADAYAGAQNEGAVDWLSLVPIPGDSYTKAVTSVYRIETAGGNPPKSCSQSDPAAIYVPYAAQYWFYN